MQTLAWNGEEAGRIEGRAIAGVAPGSQRLSLPTPVGVVNLVFGDPAAVTARLIAAPEVRAVTFTGSTRVGRIVAAQAAQGLKRAVLELGGHAPVLVDADADLDLAISSTLPAKFGSAG